MKFCIIGTGRSGTTFLCRLLNQHPDLFVFNETHWIPKMYEWFGLEQAKPEDLIHILLNTFHVTGKKTTEIEYEVLANLFSDKRFISVEEFSSRVGIYFAKQAGKQYWADKTPDYGPWMSVIQKLWPDCKFIHLVRHGADVSMSMSHHPGFQWMASAKEDSWVPVSYNGYYQSISVKENSVEDYQGLWYRRFKRIRFESTLLTEGSYAEFRFESFETQPEKLLKEISSFINIDAPDDWINTAIEQIDLKRISSRRDNRNQVNFSHEQNQLLAELGYEI